MHESGCVCFFALTSRNHSISRFIRFSIFEECLSMCSICRKGHQVNAFYSFDKKLTGIVIWFFFLAFLFRVNTRSGKNVYYWNLIMKLKFSIYMRSQPIVLFFVFFSLWIWFGFEIDTFEHLNRNSNGHFKLIGWFKKWHDHRDFHWCSMIHK